MAIHITFIYILWKIYRNNIDWHLLNKNFNIIWLEKIQQRIVRTEYNRVPLFQVIIFLPILWNISQLLISIFWY